MSSINNVCFSMPMYAFMYWFTGPHYVTQTEILMRLCLSLANYNFPSAVEFLWNYPLLYPLARSINHNSFQNNCQVYQCFCFQSSRWAIYYSPSPSIKPTRFEVRVGKLAKLNKDNMLNVAFLPASWLLETHPNYCFLLSVA